VTVPDSEQELSGSNSDLLKRIRDTYARYQAAWADQIEAIKCDQALMANRPFTSQEIRLRGLNRPLVLTEKLSQYTNQVINQLHQNPRGVNFSSQDLAAGRDFAAKRASMARAIERDSDAQAAYSTAFEHAVAYGGIGFIRLFQEYESFDSDQQVLRIGRVANPLSILPDPNSQKIDFTDMRRCFVLERIPHEDFRAEYPRAQIKSFSSELQREYPGWIGDRDLTIAEFWEVAISPDTLLILPYGKKIRLSQLPADSNFQKTGDRDGLIQTLGAPDLPVRWMDIKVPSTTQYVTNGVEILKQTPWPLPRIPIYPVVGREQWFYDNGILKRVFASMIRYTAWSIKGMAYVRSLQVELAQMTPKTPWVAIEGQLEGFEEKWAKVHTEPQGFLYYRGLLEGYGQALLPEPKRLPYDPPIVALEALHQAFERDLQSALGMYRASVGDETGTASGVMAKVLDTQSDQGASHFLHNLHLSIEALWTDINEMMDCTYDTARCVAGIEPDGTSSVIALNDPQNPDALLMNHGKFKTSISVGPSMESEADDAKNLMASLLAIPGVMERAGDLIVKLGGKGPIVDQIAERFAPPDAGEATTEQLTARIEGMKQELAIVRGQLDQAVSELVARKFETDSKEYIALINNETKLAIEQLKLDAAAAQKDIDALLAQINARQAELHRQQLLPAPPTAQVAEGAQPSNGGLTEF
jgi:hypothetical protein